LFKFLKWTDLELILAKQRRHNSAVVIKQLEKTSRSFISEWVLIYTRLTIIEFAHLHKTKNRISPKLACYHAWQNVSLIISVQKVWIVTLEVTM